MTPLKASVVIREEVIRHICIPTALLGSPGPPAGEPFSASELQAGEWGGGPWVMTWVQCDYSHFARSSRDGLWQSCDLMDLVLEYNEVTIIIESIFLREDVDDAMATEGSGGPGSLVTCQELP